MGLVRLIDSQAYGIHHMSGSGSCSWYEFANEIFSQAGVVTRVLATTTDMMERPATRPANSVLASGRETPIVLPEWKRGLSEYLARREQPEPEPKQRRRSSSRRQPVLPLHDEHAEGEEGEESPDEETPAEETHEEEVEER
jgi:hypothetical protein